MLKIEFDASNTLVARAIGNALLEIANGRQSAITPMEFSTTEHNVAEANQTAVEFNEAIAAISDTEQHITTAEMDDELVGKSVGTATELDGSTATQTSDLAGVNTATGKPTHDEKGVIFIPAICANAAKPFYASGPYKGQWKKGTKVDQAEYDRVYGAALAELTTTTPAQVYPDGLLANTQQTAVGASVAAQVFGNPIDQVIEEQPATPAEAFEVFTYLLTNNGQGVAEAIIKAAGLDNGTLIFSRPDLAPRLFKSLTTAKAQLVGA